MPPAVQDLKAEGVNFPKWVNTSWTLPVAQVDGIKVYQNFGGKEFNLRATLDGNATYYLDKMALVHVPSFSYVQCFNNPDAAGLGGGYGDMVLAYVNLCESLNNLFDHSKFNQPYVNITLLLID